MQEMNFLQRLFGHLHTINTHRRIVRSLCFRCGLYKQGLLHDLSKYSFAEFWPSVRYFQGYRSPITYEKSIKGYSDCWLHHKGRNKHHWEYWVDRLSNKTELSTIKMPFNYMLESVCDKIGASKVCKKKDYTIEYPYEFFTNSKEIHVMNPETARQITALLEYLKDNGEEKALEYYKSLYNSYKKDKNFSF